MDADTTTLQRRAHTTTTTTKNLKMQPYNEGATNGIIVLAACGCLINLTVIGQKKICPPLKPASVQQPGRRSHCFPAKNIQKTRFTTTTTTTRRGRRQQRDTSKSKSKKKCHGNGNGNSNRRRTRQGQQSARRTQPTSGIDWSGRAGAGLGWSEPGRAGPSQSGRRHATMTA